MSRFAIGLFYVLLATTDSYATRIQVKTHSRVLSEPEVHGGIRFPAKTRLELTDANAVYYAWPGEDLQANGQTILAGTQLMAFGNGQVSQLWTVPGQKLKGINLSLANGTWVTFRPDGSVESLLLNAPQALHGVRLIQHVLFYRTGALKEGTLAEDQRVDGLPLRKGTVTFHPNGKLMSGTLAEDFAVSGRTFKANRRLFLNEVGAVSEGKDLTPDPES